MLERRGVDTVDGVEGVWGVGSARVRGDEVRGLEALLGSGVGGGKKGGGGEQEDKEDGDKMDTT